MPALKRVFEIICTLLLLALIALGVFYRFAWVDWNQDTNLHPDEYGLTNTLTQLTFPRSVEEYFNTRISPISPYEKFDEAGQVLLNGPDNRFRWGQWPVIIIRWLAEEAGSTGYNELRLLGRSVSALADALALAIIFWIGWRLYGARTGLLAAALSALAVMQIQQAHFMTVDNFSVLFSALAMAAAVEIARRPPVLRAPTSSAYQLNTRALPAYLLFGLGFGMALASKINLAPLGGMILAAAFLSAADLKLRRPSELRAIAGWTFVLLAAAGLATILTFRVTQPMSFRAPTGDTTFFTFTPNPTWIDNMKLASAESSGSGGGPPAEQWSDRPAIIFPLMNMVVWGLGIPLGVAAWGGLLAAGWQILRGRPTWRAHLLPALWTAGYFFFIATRWVKSVRYFLPIYPFLCLMAAWGLLALLRALKERRGVFARPELYRSGLAAWALAIALVVGGTLTWSTAFVNAVYRQEHTRIQASRWIYQHVPGPFHLGLSSAEGMAYIPISAPDGLRITRVTPFSQSFIAGAGGALTDITLPHVRNSGSGAAALTLTISAGPGTAQALETITVMVPPSSDPRGVTVQAAFHGAALTKGAPYTLTAALEDEGSLTVYRSVISNEDWDESLPVSIDGLDAGMYYTRLEMQVRWTDDEAKRQMYFQNLAQVDTIILPSQRAVWSSTRLPRMYPMTIEYYRALFDGRLGFERAAVFQAPWVIGPLQVSDAGGTLGWNAAPALPRFNFNFFAAEEAFTVYDHPPVWVFTKTGAFSMQQVEQILGAQDLSAAVFQSPYETDVTPIE